MTIVGQDKDVTINYKNMEALGIGKDDEEKFTILANAISNVQYIIARYNTEERAKEVLQEIYMAYSDWENLKAGQPEGTPKPIYKMPEE